jgi:hypothetical protein
MKQNESAPGNKQNVYRLQIKMFLHDAVMIGK